MKRTILIVAILGVCALFLGVVYVTDQKGGISTVPVELTYDQTAENTESVSDTDSLIAQYGLDILPVVLVEAGTGSLTADLFFETYSGQELTIGSTLSAEGLAVYGASYLVPVTYRGYDLEIEVDVIDTTAPELVKLEDLTVKAGDTIAYRKAVSYSDNSSNDLELVIDNSAVDVQTPGEYTVTYTVTDAGGNSQAVAMTLTVLAATAHTEEDVKDLAMAVLDKVYDPEASQYDNALALFKWVHSNIRYTHSSGDRSSVWAGAYEGLHDASGDCYAFYATYAVLLTYAGIENECVARVSDSSNHWWNLVNTGDGWYHCDTSPRRNGDGYFCFMQTDAQVEAYTRAYPEKPDYYTFDASLIPERATTIIYGYDPDTIYAKYNTENIKRILAAQTTDEQDGLTDQPEQFIDEEDNVETADVEASASKESDVSAEAEDDNGTTKKKSNKKKDKKNDTAEGTDNAEDSVADENAEVAEDVTQDAALNTAEDQNADAAADTAAIPEAGADQAVDAGGAAEPPETTVPDSDLSVGQPDNSGTDAGTSIEQPDGTGAAEAAAAGDAGTEGSGELSP